MLVWALSFFRLIYIHTFEGAELGVRSFLRSHSQCASSLLRLQAAKWLFLSSISLFSFLTSSPVLCWPSLSPLPLRLVQLTIEDLYQPEIDTPPCLSLSRIQETFFFYSFPFFTGTWKTNRRTQQKKTYHVGKRRRKSQKSGPFSLISFRFIICTVLKF